MSFLKNNAVRACFFIMLAVPGCVQTQEHSSSERITIDKSLSYGHALDKSAVKARNEIRKNPNDPAPHYYLAKAYLLENNLDGAEAEFKTIIKLSPNSAGAYYELARINATRGKSDTALEYLERAVELQPQYPEAHHALARIYEKKGDIDKAAAHQNAYIEALKAKTAEKKKEP